MPLDPQMQKIMDATLALGLPPIERMTVEQARENIRQRTPALGPVQEVKVVEEHHVPVANGTISLRLYRPSDTRPPNTRRLNTSRPKLSAPSQSRGARASSDETTRCPPASHTSGTRLDRSSSYRCSS